MPRAEEPAGASPTIAAAPTSARGDRLPGSTKVAGPDATSASAPPDPRWAELHAEAERCTRCPLHAHRTRVVFYRGAVRPSLLFVGEAPGTDEDRQGLPFVGRAGRKLDAAIAAADLGPADFGIVNLLKCRPPRNRFDAGAARTCRAFLDRQIELLAPTRLVTLGAHALRALDPAAPPVTEVAGTVRRALGRPLFPMLHPAAAMHAPKYRERWERDVGRLARWVRTASAETL